MQQWYHWAHRIIHSQRWEKLKFFFRSQGFTLELTSCSCKKNSFLAFLLQPDHMCASQTQEEKRVSTRTEWLEIPAFRTPKYRSLTLKRERLKRSWERKGLPIVYLGWEKKESWSAGRAQRSQEQKSQCWPELTLAMEGRGFPRGSVAKNSPANEGDKADAGLIPGLGRSPGRGNGNPLQYSCLKNPMDREEPGKPQPMGSQRVGHNWAHTNAPTQWKVRLWTTLRHSLKVKRVRCLPQPPKSALLS